MRAIIDSILGPVLQWLASISSYINQLSVPVSRPIDLSNYLGYFGMLGPYWLSFIQTVIGLAFIYMIAFIIVTQQGLFIKFKDMIKWW